MQLEIAQLSVKSINVPSNKDGGVKIACSTIIDFSNYGSDPGSVPIGTGGVAVSLSLQGANIAAQNFTGFRTLILCMEFDWNFANLGNGIPNFDDNNQAGDLYINVSDTGYQLRVPGMVYVMPDIGSVAPTIADQLFVRNIIVPIVATQNSTITFTKLVDGQVKAFNSEAVSGKATIVLLNYDIAPVTIA
jgi:hypothetical protein